MTYQERKQYSPKQYLFQKMDNYKSCQSEKGNFEDAQRNYECRTLRHEELMARISEAIQTERETKLAERERSEETIEHDWNCFVKSKLANKTCSP